jgi:transcriptional regulator with XRE-family HTH domain
VSEPSIDLDRLAQHLQSKMEREDRSLRQAATEIGCSPATLSRLLKGADAPNYPDSVTLMKASSWVGKGISDFETGNKAPATLADVEVHLRALPGINAGDKEALVAMVRAAYDAASRLRKPKK